MITFTGGKFSSIRLFERLRKVLFFLAPLVFFTFGSSTYADGINYTVASTSEINDLQFWFTFTLPSTVSSLDTFTTATFMDTADEFFTNLPTEVIFPPSEPGQGLLEIKVHNSLFDGELFEFFGPQIYSGTSAPFTLLMGTFPVTGRLFISPEFTTALVGGSVTATAAAIPEPGTLALLGSGLFAIGVLRRKRA